MKINELIKYLEDEKSLKISGYFSSYMGDIDKGYELKGVLQHIEKKSSIRLLNRLLDLNENIIDDFTSFSLMHNAHFLSMCIESGRFDIDLVDHLGFTALFRCCSRPEDMVENIPEMVSLLLDGGADPNKTCDATFQFPKLVKHNYTPLMRAAECDSENVIKLLLKNGANPDLKNSLAETALDLAISKNRQKAINALRGK